MILSLVWQDVDKAGFSVENDIAYNIVKKHQYEDVADLQDLEPRDQAYRQHVRRIVGKLREVIEHNLNAAVGNHPFRTTPWGSRSTKKAL